MKHIYKTIMFLTLFIFCVGSVCAADTDNTTVNDNHSVDNVTNTHVSDIKQLEDKRDKLGLEIKQLKNSNADKNLINEKEVEVRGLQIEINNKIIKGLKDSNSQKDKKISILSNEIKGLNQILNDRVDKQYDEIKSLHAKIDYQNNEINKLNDEINKLNNEIEQLKRTNNELKGLNISYVEAQKSIKWVTEYIQQHNKKPTTVKCGKTTFKIGDYLNLLFVKVGKAGINIFNNEKGRLPNYLTIAGYKVPQKVYKKLFNIK